MNQYHKEWRKANRDKVKEYNKRYEEVAKDKHNQWLIVAQETSTKMPDHLKGWKEELEEEGLLEVESMDQYIDRRAEEIRMMKAKFRENKSVPNPTKSKSEGDFYKSAKGLLTSLSVQVKATVKRKGLDEPTWISDASEFKQWVANQPDFERMYNVWKQSNYLTIFKPTIQRVDPSKTFDLDNIMIVKSGDRKYESKHLKK